MPFLPVARLEGGGVGQTHSLRTRAEPGRSPAWRRAARMRPATSSGGIRWSRHGGIDVPSGSAPESGGERVGRVEGLTTSPFRRLGGEEERRRRAADVGGGASG